MDIPDTTEDRVKNKPAALRLLDVKQASFGNMPRHANNGLLACDRKLCNRVTNEYNIYIYT